MHYVDIIYIDIIIYKIYISIYIYIYIYYYMKIYFVFTIKNKLINIAFIKRGFATSRI